MRPDLSSRPTAHPTHLTHPTGPPALLALLALLAVVVGVLITAGLLTAPAAEANPADRYARQAVTATNEARADRDRAALGRDRCLQRKATQHARDMADQQRMFHQDLGPVLRDCEMSRVGENVAHGYETGRAVVRGWMGSEGHRANILNRAYRHVAVAAARDDDGRWYTAQVFGTRA